MEKYIIIIGIIILLIVFIINNIYKTKKEDFEISDGDNIVFNNMIQNLMFDESITVPNMNISNSLLIKSENIDELITKFKYPVGCYYVQYPDSNTNIIIRDSIITPFPRDKSPAVLFGGTWIEVYNTDSIYFRTGKDNTNAYEDDTRIDGFQDYAMKKITGWTSWAQGGRTRKNSEECGNINDIKTGVFTKSEIASCTIDRECAGGGTDAQTFKFDTLNVIPVSNLSDQEVRVKNRLIKIWKRIG